MATAASAHIRAIGDWRLTAAPAKVNLGLRVTGRRADGYHLLDSVVAFAGVADHVAIRATAATPAFHLRGPFARALVDAGADTNLAHVAAARFHETFGGPKVDIVLWKRLPVAAGVGGGSADAAAVLRLLAANVGVALDDPRLLAMALALGADTPMCLIGRTVRVGGVGELLDRAPDMPPLPALLANPGIAVATPAVFGARASAFSVPGKLAARYEGLNAAAAALRGFGNDLTAPAMTIAPVIGDLLGALEQSDEVLYAGMSGSGATCFALFPTRDAARAAARALARRRSSWWVAATVLNAAM